MPPMDRKSPEGIIGSAISLDGPRIAALVCGLLVALLGALVMVGWATGTALLTAVAAGWPAMQPQTALAFVFAGLALMLASGGRHHASWVMAAVVALIAASALVQHATGLSLGLDTLLFPERVLAQSARFPGRMGEVSSIEFLLFCVCLALAGLGRHHAFAAMASLGLLGAGMGIAGYLFGSSGLSLLDSYASMAALTTFAFLLLFLGLLLMRAEQTWLRTLLSAHTGGVVARRLVPAVIGFPLLIGLVVTHWGGVWGTPAATVVGIGMALLGAGQFVLALWIARALDAAEERDELAGRTLRRTEARLRSIVETAVDGMVVIDDTGTIQSFNRAAGTLFGYTEEEVLGRDVAMLMAEPHAAQHQKYLQNYRRTGVARIIGIGREVEGRRKDGTLFPADLAIAEWRDEGRSFFTGILRDITARKAAETAVRESEARFRTVFKQAAIGIERISLEGAFLEVNDKACELLGYTAEDLKSLSIWDVTDPLDLPEERRLVAEMQAGARDNFVIEKRRRRKDGRQIWVRVTSSVPRANARLPYRISVVEDITARRAMEADLREAKDQAEKANRDKSRFLAAASHDLRQPVQAMMLMASVMGGQLKGHPAAPMVAGITESINALTTLLSGLLDVSRLDAGVVEPKPEVIRLSDVIERLAAESRLHADEKGLSLKVVRCGAMVRTDPTLLERILRNLIDNAVRYTNRGGIVIGCRRRGETVALQVVDTGIGIGIEDQEAIFQEFYQVGNPERDRAKGLGLGLAIVKRLALLLALDLRISSVPSRGTCFSIFLPVVGRAEHTPAPAVRAVADQCRGLVLVIDDEPMVRLGLAALLESWGCEVATAGDAGEAVAWATSTGRCPDVILADYRLRDGHTGTNAVREVFMACGRRVPVVIITGDTAPERIAEVSRSGFEIAHKPVAPERLRQLVKAAVG